MLTKNLGTVIASFKPAKKEMLAGFILSGLMLAAGAACLFFPWRGAYLANWDIPFDAKKGWCWEAVIFGSVCGVALLLGGL